MESTANGWLYTAFLPDSKVINIFFAEVMLIRTLKSDALAFQALIAKTILTKNAMGQVKLGKSDFFLFPVYSSLLSQAAGDNWIAVGDAASCFDPIVSQGICKALNNGISAGRAIADKIKNEAATVLAYKQGIRSAYGQYYSDRNLLYSREKRWINSPFWSNRKGIRYPQDL